MKFARALTLPLLFATALSACIPASMPQDAMGDKAVDTTMTKSDSMAASDEMTKTDTMAESEVMSATLSKEEDMSAVMTDTMKEGEAMADDTMMSHIGAFTGRDAQHQGSGTAELTQVDGSYQLKLTNFSSSDGPDLYVYLVENPNTWEASELGQIIDLGLLQSLSGDQSYTVPADVDLSKVHGAIIYCKEFSFVFSVAPFTQ